ncbi:hypothetical protein [Pseudooctadecabacter sp.]|uniref:hypothetical protein n=1 Tax=Pseudooctadecabacter sp. TaxID=1966338 RepID=UPI0025F2C731|nr:hypothetical protein [Pseudooctadecabacter sp.]
MAKRNFTVLPVLVVLMIAGVTLFMIFTERTNAPDISGDPDYPHYVCTFERYCVGEACTSNPIYIIAYTEYVDGQPRLEIPGMDPRATLDRTDETLTFTSTGGDVAGRLILFRDRALDFYATSDVEGEPDPREHFASGRCDRLVSP